MWGMERQVKGNRVQGGTVLSHGWSREALLIRRHLTLSPQESEGLTLGEGLLSRQNSKCKGPEASTSLEVWEGEQGLPTAGSEAAMGVAAGSCRAWWTVVRSFASTGR